MYIVFTYNHGGNPYIAKTNREAFRIFCKYYTVQTDARAFLILGLRQYNGKQDYKTKQLVLDAVARDWQEDFNRFSYTWDDLAEWGDFFRENGQRFGLLRTFKENGII